MNAGRNQVTQRLIHQAVAGYGIDAGKDRRHQGEFKMTAAAGGASMAGVCGAVVVQVDFLRGQRGQALMNQCVQRQGFAHVRTPA